MKAPHALARGRGDLGPTRLLCARLLESAISDDRNLRSHHGLPGMSSEIVVPRDARRSACVRPRL